MSHLLTRERERPEVYAFDQQIANEDNLKQPNLMN